MKNTIKKIVTKIKENKILTILVNLINIILATALILILSVILVQKFSDNNLSIGGIRLYCVSSSSMTPEYKIGDIVVTKESKENEIKIGDNVTYIGKVGKLNGIIITHKIVDIRQDGKDYYFTTKGVANDVEDPEISYDQIYGKVIYKTKVLSYVSKISTSLVVYLIVMIIGILTSISIVKSIFYETQKELEDGEDEGDGNGEEKEE